MKSKMEVGGQAARVLLEVTLETYLAKEGSDLLEPIFG